MSEKLDALRQSALKTKAQNEVKTASTASEPFIPGVVEPEQPKRHPLVAPKERTVIGPDGNPIVRKEADLSSLPKEEDPNEGKPKSLQEEVLKPGGMFDKYLARKTAEAQEYLSKKTFKDDEIEQTPDGENISVEEDQPALDEDEAELENAYQESQGSVSYVRRDLDELSGHKKEETMAEETREATAPEKEEELLELDQVSEEDKEEAVTGMEQALKEEAADGEPKREKIIIPAGEVLKDDYKYPDKIDLPSEDEMDTLLNGVAKADPEPDKAPTATSSYHLDVSEDADEEDDDMAELLDKETEEEEQERLLTDLRAQITEKIRPVVTSRDIRGFTVVKNAKVEMAVPKATGRSAAKWVLPNTGVIVEMSEFGGAEIDYLRDNNDWRNVTKVRNALKMIYDHVVSPKPQKFENWMKTIAFSDQDHLFMCAYIAGFANSNYVPYTCENLKCKYMFLSENLPILEMVKFKTDGRKKFDALYNSNRTNAGGLYVTEVMPVSERYAFAMVVPSLYDVYIEGGSFSAAFREKYKRNIGIVPYVDTIYEIDWETGRLIEKHYQVFENNPTKTAKSKAIFYSKVLDTLSTDEYATVYAMMNALEDRADWFDYQIPETSCPKCKGKIEAEPTTAREVFFTRHRLGLLANTSIK